MKGISSSKGSDLRKTRTFVVQRNQNQRAYMQQQQQQQEAVGGVPHNNIIEMKKSPQLMHGEEMIHFSHPGHPLSRMCLADLFTCRGCKEYGAGNRFSCQHCDFQLHDFCALSPPVLKAHPFHSHHQLLFYSKPVKGGLMQSKCDVCAKPIKGFAFRCGVCTSFQMHPCCAMLSWEIKLPSLHPHAPLRMLPLDSSSSSGSFVCGECKKRKSGRVYSCTVCEYHVHAACAKGVKNGLRDNGHKGSEKASVLGTAARLASQVVVELLGGIIEGLGEGVGEALVQNIKGKGAPSTSPIPRRRP